MTKKITANLQAQAKRIDYNYDFNRLIAISHPTSRATTSPTPTARRAAAMPTATPRAASRGSPRRWAARSAKYGRLGETVYEKKTVTTFTGPLPEVYETRYNFETFGRLLRITYPDGEVVTNTYDSGGNLSHLEA